MVAREDIESLVRRGKRYVRGGRWRVRLMLIISILLLLPIMIGITTGRIRPNSGGIATINFDSLEMPLSLFRWEDEAWTRASYFAFDGASQVFQAAEDVWVASNNHLYHLQEDVWVPLPLPPGPDLGYISPIIGLGEIWFDDYNGNLWQYDGRTWIRHPQPSLTALIAVTRHGTIILDEALNFSRYYEGRWSRQSLREAIPALAQTLSSDYGGYEILDYVAFHNSDDSDLYLDLGRADKGIWRFDGETWRIAYYDPSALPLEDGGNYVSLIEGGQGNGDILWLTGDHMVQRIPVATGVAQTIDLPRAFKPHDWIVNLTAHKEVVLIEIALMSGYNRLYQQTTLGGAWTEISMPTVADSQVVSALILQEDGSPMIAIQDMSAYSAAASGFQGMFPSGSMDAGIALAALLGISALFLLVFLDMVIIYIPEFLVKRRRWRDAHVAFTPLYAELEIPLAKARNPHGIFNLIFGAISHVIWILMVMGGSFFLLVTFILGDITTLSATTPSITTQIGVLLGVGGILGYWASRVISFGIGRTANDRTASQILRWILNGEYDEALLSLVVPGRLENEPSYPYPFLYLLALMMSGQNEAAESAARAQLKNIRSLDPLSACGTILLLGVVISRIPRRESEAEHLITAVVYAFPDSRTNFSEWIIYTLRQTSQTDLALVLSDALMEFNSRSRTLITLERQLEKGLFAEALGLRAWALAANGRMAEAEPLLAQALAIKLTGNRQGVATLNKYAAEIATLKGDRNAARAHYERTAEADPNGWDGQQARAALANLS